MMRRYLRVGDSTMKKYSTVIFLMGSLFAAVQVGCGRSAAGTDTKHQEVTPKEKIDVTKVTTATVHRRVNLPATISGYEQASIMAKIDGYVKKVNVNIGDEVHQGQILVVLDVPELEHEINRKSQIVLQARAEVKVREAELEAAKAKLSELEALIQLRQSEQNRFARLVEAGAVKRQKQEEAFYALASAKATLATTHHQIATAKARIESAKKQVAVTNAELAHTQAMADYREIKAPFDGLITKRSVDAGAFVRPAHRGSGAKPLLTITRNDKVRVIVYLTMESTASLDVNDTVSLKVIDMPDATFSGVISRFAKAYDEGARMMRAEIDLDNPKDDTTGKRKLRPGSYGSVTITLETFQGPTVPKSALAHLDGKDYVMLVDQEGIFRRTRVEVAITSGETVGLKSGVEQGMTVAQDSSKAHDGKKVPLGSLDTKTP